MLFGYSRGIKHLDISYNEFQPGGSFPAVRQPLPDALPRCPCGDRAVSDLATQSSVQSDGADRSRTQAALNAGGTGGCTGRAEPPGSC